MNWYHSLCDSIDVKPVTTRTPVTDLSDINQLANASVSDRLANALSVFMDLLMEENSPVLNKVDRCLIDHMIARLDI